MLQGRCHCGRVAWRLDAVPESATACSCTACVRYGALWAYGYLNHDIHLTGEAEAYRRTDAEAGALSFMFCGACGCLTHYLSTAPDADGRLRTAVNLRMTEIETIKRLPIDHFDGRDRWEDRPRDGRTVEDLWF